MVKKYTQQELEEYAKNLVTESQLKLSHQNEQIEKLKKENERLISELAALKKKEKASNRAIVLAERKAKYIGDVTKSRCAIEIDRLTRLSERYSGLFDKLEAADQQLLQEFNDELTKTIGTLGGLGEYIEDRKPLSQPEKNYISEKERISLTEAVKSDLDERFNKLVSEFKQKIGDSASRGRGRPKKSEQSMLAEVNKVVTSTAADELSEAEKQEVISKINELFYSVQPNTNTTAGKQKAKDKNKKQGEFDFDEALNPTESLADIMKDLKD